MKEEGRNQDFDDLDYSLFDARSGLDKMFQLFGDHMDALIDELNREMVA
ncbi:MAG: hypothetical protein KA152_18660 [Verrucomicrobiales bacterium]|nr:hypothetical protein [Verrucomicrobiales bacterium]MBP9226480.1 hypothetical protein [Verrucomicrobiales bacterium]